ncbi:MAG: hypothetical protein ACLUD7_03910 [Lachnospiraceae bacterium]
MEKERRTKALVVVVLLIVVAGLTIAFAALSTTLNINGTAYLDAAKWGIRFENLSEPVKLGTAAVTGTAEIEETKSAEITGINVSLSTPGDKVTYTVDLVNKGTINAKIDNIEKTVLTSEQQRYLTFKVTDQNEKEISQGDILSAGETRNLTITIEFIKDLTKEDLPKQTSTISLSYKLNFVQTDEKATTSDSSKQACTTFDKKDTYNVGDVIALCNTSTNKSEDFYVMKDNGTTVTALAKYNLLVGNTVVLNDDFSDISSLTPISTSEEGYGLQNSIAANYEWDETGAPKINTIKGGVAFADGEESKKIINCTGNSCYYGYWTADTSNHNLLSKYGNSYPVNVFDSNSNLYKPLENYKTYLKNTLGKTSIEAKLMTYEDLISLGCNKDNFVSTSAPSWIYSTNYWSESAYDDSDVWSVYSNGYFAGGGFSSSGFFGLRPVITIKKSEL